MQVWLCLALMIVSAFLGGRSDLRFNLNGYSWQVSVCVRGGGVSPPYAPRPAVIRGGPRHKKGAPARAGGIETMGVGPFIRTERRSFIKECLWYSGRTVPCQF